MKGILPTLQAEESEMVPARHQDPASLTIVISRVHTGYIKREFQVEGKNRQIPTSTLCILACSTVLREGLVPPHGQPRGHSHTSK